MWTKAAGLSVGHYSLSHLRDILVKMTSSAIECTRATFQSACWPWPSPGAGVGESVLGPMLGTLIQERPQDSDRVAFPCLASVFPF